MELSQKYTILVSYKFNGNKVSKSEISQIYSNVIAYHNVVARHLCYVFLFLHFRSYKNPDNHKFMMATQFLQRYGDTGMLRSHMRGAVAERRRTDFDIPAPLPRVCSHIRGVDAGGSAISWGQWWFGARGFEAGAVNWVLDPFLAERFLLPLRLRFTTAHVWTHVMICVEANFPPAPARVRPRMCEATFTLARSGCGAEAGGFWYSRSATAGMFTYARSGPIFCRAVFAPAPP